MPSRRYPKNALLALKAAELATAAPQVVAHRVNRMAAAEFPLSAQDQQEFLRMGTEKAAAFYESWNAMALQAMRANQAMAQTFWLSMLSGNPPSAASAMLNMQSAALTIMSHGMAPVHRRAVANAKRLGKIK